MSDNNAIHTVQPERERIGLVVDGTDTVRAVKTIVAAEAAGVRQIWMTQSGTNPDTLITFAAAAVSTSSIRLGSAIIPVYPRHPLFMAQQALALNDLAPGRIRLGIGTSHRPVVEGVYGIPMVTPLTYLEEYVTVLSTLLHEGKIEHQGRFITTKATLPRIPRVPVLISTLREHAFYLAGKLSDGALPWLCPIPYLLNKALPALRAGAASNGRPVPPLIAHVLVALSEEHEAVRESTRRILGRYVAMPFYASMFADAGFPIPADKSVPDALINSLVISGNESTVAARFQELLNMDLDELLVLQVPTVNADDERARLINLIGRL